MTTPINSSTPSTAATDPASLTSSLTGGQTLGKDDFLKLLVAQLKNQDPLAPQDNTQFVAQLAQFSSVEQSMAMNSKLDQLSSQTTGLANSADVSLVGKTISARGNFLSIDGTGVGAPVSFTLEGASASTKIGITDQSGRTVRTFDVGAHGAGFVRTQWDGRDDTGVVQPAGTYVVSVVAKDTNGNAVSADQESTGTVTSLSFDKGYPVLDLDNGLSVPVSDLLKVVSPQTP